MSIIIKDQVKVTMRQKKIGNMISWKSNVTTIYCCVTNHPKTSWLKKTTFILLINLQCGQGSVETNHISSSSIISWA